MPVTPDTNRSISKERRGRGCWGELNTTFVRSWASWRRNSGTPPTTDLNCVLNVAHKSLFLSWLAPPSAHSICSEPSLISSRLLTNLISSLGSLESIFYFTQQSETLVGASSSLRPIIWINNVLHLSFPASLQLQSTDVFPSTQDSPTSTSAGPGLVYNGCGSVRAPHSLLQQHCPLLYKYKSPLPKNSHSASISPR